MTEALEESETPALIVGSAAKFAGESKKAFQDCLDKMDFQKLTKNQAWAVVKGDDCPTLNNYPLVKNGGLFFFTCSSSGQTTSFTLKGRVVGIQRNTMSSIYMVTTSAVFLIELSKKKQDRKAVNPTDAKKTKDYFGAIGQSSFIFLIFNTFWIESTKAAVLQFANADFLGLASGPAIAFLTTFRDLYTAFVYKNEFTQLEFMHEGACSLMQVTQAVPLLRTFALDVLKEIGDQLEPAQAHTKGNNDFEGGSEFSPFIQ